uniref:ArsR/SmtB family transcription factor n=1 Tax=Stappia sp. TaxID=1870903 RepID=UPI003BAB02E0
MDSEQLDRVFKALADPTRRRIVEQLREGPAQSLFQICATVSANQTAPISRQAISQHLEMLGRAGLLRVSWSGRTKLHALELAPLREAAEHWLLRQLREEGGEA